MELKLSVDASDPEYTLVDLVASNGAFAGSTRIYLRPGQAAELAGSLEGFPAQVPDEREYLLGYREPRMARGSCLVQVRTVSGGGKAVIEVDIENEDATSTARFSMSFTPAALDRFVTALRHLEGDGGRSATLETYAVEESIPSD